MTPERKALVLHRFARAETSLQEAKDELARKNPRLAVNRAYYTVFYAMRAFLATVGKDSSKHSGIAALFNEHFIKSKIVPAVSSKLIQLLMDLRHEGDYQDFAVITEEEAKGAVETAQSALHTMRIVMKKLVA